MANEADAGRIVTVYIWQNDMTMVFNQWGEQMPDYQGRIHEVYDALVRDTDERTTFITGTWRVVGSDHSISKEEFVRRYAHQRNQRAGQPGGEGA